MLPLREILPAQAALYSVAESQLPSERPTFLIVDPVEPSTGLLLEDIELILLEARLQLPNTHLGLHLTYWPAAFAYGEAWGLDFLLYHEPTFQAVQGYTAEGSFLERIGGWTPPRLGTP